MAKSLTLEEKMMYKQDRKLLNTMGVSWLRLQFDFITGIMPYRNKLSVEDIIERLHKVYPDLNKDELKDKVPEIIGKTYAPRQYSSYGYRFQACGKESYTLHSYTCAWLT